jgi:hypothetical protein
VIIMWAWESSAPGAAASGVCADADSAQRAASAWMRANGADAGLLEEVLLVLGAGSLLTRHERTGRVTPVPAGRVESPRNLSTSFYHMMHVTRHTFVSACPSEGISVRAVAEFIGDTEATVQQTYSHMMPDDREPARKAIERFFARSADGDRLKAGRS